MAGSLSAAGSIIRRWWLSSADEYIAKVSAPVAVSPSAADADGSCPALPSGLSSVSEGGIDQPEQLLPGREPFEVAPDLIGEERLGHLCRVGDVWSDQAVVEAP